MTNLKILTLIQQYLLSSEEYWYSAENTEEIDEYISGLIEIERKYTQ